MSLTSLVIYIPLFFVIELVYFEIAKKYNIIDKPNLRKLHTQSTIRGGGIIFWFAILIFFVQNNFILPYFFFGLTLICFISFIDDIISLSNKARFFAQIVAIGLMLFEIGFGLNYFVLLIFGIIMIGILNAYNFMDGINGITGLYSLINSISLCFLYKEYEIGFNNDIFVFLIISLAVFLFFNLRKNALCFGGDIGSIGIGYILIFLIGWLIKETNNYKYIFLLSCYGIDAIYTILYRLSIKENIFKAHKLHFFQILTYKFNWSHIQVSVLYCLMQLILNLWIFRFELNSLVFYIPILLVLSMVHFQRNKVNLALAIK